MTHQVLDEIANIGFIPFISIDDMQKVSPLANALKKGGLPVLEILVKTDSSFEGIKTISANNPDFIVGAGSVDTLEQLDKAIECGAKFIITTGFDPELCKKSLSQGVSVIPSCETSSEIDEAISLGLNVITIISSSDNGGFNTMKSLAEIYPKLRFILKGNLSSLICKEYLNSHRVLAVSSDFMFSYKDLNSDNFEKIALDVEQAILEYLSFHVTHVGMNANSKEESIDLANKLGKVLKVPTHEYGKSAFAGNLFEIMYAAIGTYDATRAYAYLKRCGVEFYDDSVTHDENGDVIAAYMKENFGGFALHLLQD